MAGSFQFPKAAAGAGGAGTTFSLGGGGLGGGGLGGASGLSKPATSAGAFSLGGGGGATSLTGGAGGFAGLTGSKPPGTPAAGAGALGGGFSLGSGGLGGSLLGGAAPATTKAPPTGLGAGLASSLTGGATGGLPAATSTPKPGGFALPGLGSAGGAAATPAATGALGALGGGLKLGGATTGTTTPATTGFAGLGGAAKPATTAAPATGFAGLGGAKPATTGFAGLGGTTPAATAGGAGLPKLGGGLGLTSASTTASPLGGATLGAGSAGAVKTTYKELEENLNKWQRELNNHVAKFREQARAVNRWDEILLNNGEKITALYADVEKVANQQKRLERTLTMIQGQQREIHSLLEPLEEKIKERQESNPLLQYDRYADQERDRTFTLAENVKSELDNMHVHLKDMITRINSLSASDNDDEDPIDQIGNVLSHHMVALQWIDQNTEAVQRRVHQLESSRQAVMQRQTYF